MSLFIKDWRAPEGLAAAKDLSGLCWEGLEFCRQTWLLLATPGPLRNGVLTATSAAKSQRE